MKTGLKQTSIWLHEDHMRQMAVVARQRGLKTAQLVRLVIVDFLRRSAKEDSK